MQTDSEKKKDVRKKTKSHDVSPDSEFYCAGKTMETVKKSTRTDVETTTFLTFLIIIIIIETTNSKYSHNRWKQNTKMHFIVLILCKSG